MNGIRYCLISKTNLLKSLLFIKRLIIFATNKTTNVMKIEIDRTSNNKHYVEKDNYIIAENEKVLTIKPTFNEDDECCETSFDKAVDILCSLGRVNSVNRYLIKFLNHFGGLYGTVNDIFDAISNTPFGWTKNRHTFDQALKNALTRKVIKRNLKAKFTNFPGFDISDYKNEDIEGIYIKLK